MKRILTLAALLITMSASTAFAADTCFETTHAEKLAELDELEATALRDHDERLLLKVHNTRQEMRRVHELQQLKKVALKKTDATSNTRSGS